MKLTQIFKVLFLYLFFGNLKASDNKWQDTVNQYNILCAKLDNNFINIKDFCSDYWNSQRLRLSNIILSQTNQDLWKHQFLHQDMIRGGINISQEYEICYIKSCLSKPIQNLLLSYKDVKLSGIPIECKEFQCSTNTLGHLFYAGKILEKAACKNVNIKKIVEFGSGYGNIARIFKTLLPESTLILIDLPEYLALQYYFLKSTLSEKIKIIMHSTLPQNFEDFAIHLIPVYLIDNLDFDIDLFISTFALSEAPSLVQKKISQKKFFRASIIYLTGQLDGGTEVKMVDHRFMIDSIRTIYREVDCHPFHNLFQALHSYEIIGNNLKTY